jgi:DNA-binding response OmpR family regulator
VAVCETGKAGIAALRAHRPTIATIDIQMPGDVNGFGVVKAAVAANLPSKLVMCSGTVNRNSRAMAIDAGADAFIAKPYDQVLVARELAGILSG